MNLKMSQTLFCLREMYSWGPYLRVPTESYTSKCLIWWAGIHVNYRRKPRDGQLSRGWWAWENLILSQYDMVEKGKDYSIETEALISCIIICLQKECLDRMKMASTNTEVPWHWFPNSGLKFHLLCLWPTKPFDGGGSIWAARLRLSFKPPFSLSSFTFIKRLFSSSSLSAIRMA